jgi:hypothetical protein
MIADLGGRRSFITFPAGIVAAWLVAAQAWQ